MNTKWFFLLPVSLFLWFSIQGCNKTEQGNEESSDTSEDMIDAPRRDIVLTKSQEAYVKAGNQFAFNWLKILEEEQSGNWFVSPLSFQFALGMLANGAHGPALTELCEILGCGQDGISAHNDYIKSLLSQLDGIDPNTDSRIANMILADEEFPFTSEYKEKISNVYKASVNEMSFYNKSAVIEWVNKWASDNTNGMIPQAISDINDDVVSILGNTVYFKGKWVSRFSKENTKELPFYLADGTKKTISMMRQEGRFLCNPAKTYKQITLPYGNGAFQMLVFLPSGNNKIKDVLVSLQEEGIFYGFPYQADLWLPAFESETKELDLKPHLAKLGLSSSSLSGIYYVDMQPRMAVNGYIDDVLHSAKIKVDEAGSEAAGVTIITNVASASLESLNTVFEFHADHPFLYLITEVSTGTIFFAGKYSGRSN
jgi:serpin B